MDIRADLSQPACVHTKDWTWVDSPQPGVRRVMLDRVGDEVAVATSFVRYDPDSRFSSHEHALGEEFIVLEGEFGDEHGRYPAGHYVRNPPGSHHVPFSEPGCLIWVKLRQFQTNDLTPLRTRFELAIPEHGVDRRRHHDHGQEQVDEIVLAAGAALQLDARSVCQEVLVLDGAVACDPDRLDRWSWIRVPAGRRVSIRALAPSRLFWKTRPERAPDPATAGPA